MWKSPVVNFKHLNFHCDVLRENVKTHSYIFQKVHNTRVHELKYIRNIYDYVL